MISSWEVVKIKNSLFRVDIRIYFGPGMRNAREFLKQAPIMNIAYPLELIPRSGQMNGVCNSHTPHKIGKVQPVYNTGSPQAFI